MGEPRSQEGRPLGLAVVGLGRCWRRRYRPALRALRRLFRVAAVFDQVAAVARREARRLGCTAAGGPTEMLQRPDVHALLLLDRQWFGLWPLQAACRLGKAVFCRASLAHRDPQAQRLLNLIQESGHPVMVGLAAPFCPVLAHLRNLLTEQLGPARLLLGSLTLPMRQQQSRADRAHPGWDLLACLPSLLSRCTMLGMGAPRRLLASATGDGALASLLLDWGAGRGGQLALAYAPVGRRSWQLQVVAERGTAKAEPGQLHWRSPEGNLSQAFPRPRPAAWALLEAFHRTLTDGQPRPPSLADALRLGAWVRLAGRSLAEGGWVSLGA